MYVVVHDTDPRVVGPFATEKEASDWIDREEARSGSSPMGWTIVALTAPEQP